MILWRNKKNEPAHGITSRRTCAISKDSDQPAHPTVWSEYAQSDQSLHWLHVPSTAFRLSKEEWIKTFVINSGYTGWSESVLVTQVLLSVLLCSGSNISILVGISVWSYEYGGNITFDFLQLLDVSAINLVKGEAPYSPAHLAVSYMMN